MAVQTSDYLRKIQGQFNAAKADALELINRSDQRKVKAVAPVETDFIPFDSQNLQNAPALDVHSISQISADFPKFDPLRTTENFYKNYPFDKIFNVVADKEILTVLPARPIDGEICVIDWLNITVSASTFDDDDTRKMTSESLRVAKLVQNVSKLLLDILGFAVAEKLPNGRNFYDYAYKLEHNAGFVCVGGQKDTLLIMLTGTGCTYAKHGWQLNLYSWLKISAITPKITRIDLAHDDLAGVRSLSWFTREFDKGGFTSGGRRQPKIEMLGNWKRPDGSGRTLNIGNRTSPKFCRIYEKGKKEGDKNSPWLRCEVEFKAKSQFIPLDILLKPSNFFLKAYPCFWVFNEHNISQSKFERIEKEALISMSKAIHITKHQFGRFIFAFRTEFHKKGLTDKDLLDLLTDIENKAYPDRLDKLSIPEFFKPKPKH